MARAGLIMLVAVLALAGAACRPDAEARERIARAQAATLEAGSATFSFSQSFTGSQTGEQRIDGQGALDFHTGRGRLRLTAPTAGASAGAAEFEVILDRGQLYLRLPLLELPTPWLRLHLEDELLGDLDRFREISGDPRRNLAMLHGAEDDVEILGNEQIGDVATTHYRLTVDLRRAVATAPEQDQPFLGQQLQTFGVARLPVEVWLDDGGRLRRQTYQVPLSGSGQPAGMTEDPGVLLPEAIVATIEYHDFGVPVQVSPPPPGQVTDAAALIGTAPDGP